MKNEIKLFLLLRIIRITKQNAKFISMVFNNQNFTLCVHAEMILWSNNLAIPRKCYFTQEYAAEYC